MHRISSNWTIFYKIFIPTAWLTFFGLFTLAILLSDPTSLPFGGGSVFKIGFLVFFLLFFGIMWLTIMRLKRIDMGADGLYVSNYFKTYRYRLSDIESIKEWDFMIVTIGMIKLKEKGMLGQKLYFLISKIHYNDFLSKHGDELNHLT